jgi:small nuclear ribonucleoprotein (snRNP)-like protein
MNNNSEAEAKVTKNPLSVIYKHVGTNITVVLKTGEKYTGTLSKVDNYMNLLIDEAVEEFGDKMTRYGRVLIRGNNILLIQLNKI